MSPRPALALAVRTDRACALAVALLALSQGALAAQNLAVGISVSPASSAPAIGRFVRGSQSSAFTVAAATGSVTLASGNAVRLTSGSVTTPTVTLTCTSGSGSGQSCTSSGRTFTITVTIGTASPSTSANLSLTTASVASLSGASMLTGPTVNGNTLTFTIGPFSGSTATFKLGVTLNISPTAASANVSMPFTVQISKTT